MFLFFLFFFFLSFFLSFLRRCSSSFFCVDRLAQHMLNAVSSLYCSFQGVTVSKHYPREASRGLRSAAPGDQTQLTQVNSTRLDSTQLVRRFVYVRTPCIACHFNSIVESIVTRLFSSLLLLLV